MTRFIITVTTNSRNIAESIELPCSSRSYKTKDAAIAAAFNDLGQFYPDDELAHRFPEYSKFRKILVTKSDDTSYNAIYRYIDCCLVCCTFKIFIHAITF